MFLNKLENPPVTITLKDFLRIKYNLFCYNINLLCMAPSVIIFPFLSLSRFVKSLFLLSGDIELTLKIICSFLIFVYLSFEFNLVKLENSSFPRKPSELESTASESQLWCLEFMVVNRAKIQWMKA